MPYPRLYAVPSAKGLITAPLTEFAIRDAVPLDFLFASAKAVKTDMRKGLIVTQR